MNHVGVEGILDEQRAVLGKEHRTEPNGLRAQPSHLPFSWRDGDTRHCVGIVGLSCVIAQFARPFEVGFRLLRASRHPKALAEVRYRFVEAQIFEQSETKTIQQLGRIRVEVERFPVFTVDTITHREAPIYHSTYTGRPPDEPAVLGVALNEVFVPILQKQFPEIVDFYLPPEGCSYRLAIVTMRKEYPGHAKRVMLGVWSFLRQFMYTKFVIVTDDDVDARNWKDVVWAMTTRMDPRRDSVFVDNTPIDYLDFASPVAGLGSKVGFDATNKWPGESDREWGTPITMSDEVKKRVDEIWDELGIA